MGIACELMGALMLLYSKYRKLKHRDRLLNMITRKGNESVLDAGTWRRPLVIWGC